ncbi:phosphoglycerate mutase family protein [Mucilaginibacter glaciei]|uniref:Histidine phosphatase family protein n=1 Tax=Mucilaginibacter glaciei TaxID=2772109 RepID=A0A926NTK4_9SPHI|nr:phosphoglycerate mutase family protein [Mucilaginibacter glaciei]MBD1393720.1 histidine phosphatase family protein [Mucilaginibacter glaciei]
MKIVTRTLPFFTLFLLVLLLSNFSALAQKTTIWVVRHAEKAAAAPGVENLDPSLSEDGQTRAIDLAKELKHDNIKTIYATNTKRSGQTARPLAVQARILPKVYTDSIKAFAKTLLINFRGTKVLVVAHSNTVMPLIEALGADRPLEALSEEDFDMLFKVTIKDNGKVDLEVLYYGSLHHTSELPEKFQPTRLDFKPFTGTATHF